MNKDLIKSRFKKHLSDYDDNARVQRFMAEKLADLCSKTEYGNILEIGCGTGFLTEIINSCCNFEEYVALDLVEECADYINKINPDIRFEAEDAENFIKTYQKFDLIISNATLQWINDFENMVNTLKSRLSPNGELIFSVFGKENFKEIAYILGTGLKYYSEEELRELFPSTEIYSTEIYPPEVYVMSFKTPKDVLKHIKLTGVNGIENTSWTKGDLKTFEEAYDDLCSVNPTLTYNPIYIKITNKTTG